MAELRAVEGGRDWAKFGRRIQDFIVTQFLLVSYLVSITIALAWPVPGRAVGSVKVAGNVRLVQSINIIIVFYITGLVLKTDELLKAIRQRLGVLWGFVSIMGITPLLGFAFRELPLEPPAFAAGLALFCTVPTTLGVGISLVRSCRGNEALALLLTVGTNVLAIFLMPLWLRALFSGNASLGLDVNIGAMLVKLLLTVLVPAALGKAMRDLIPAVQRFATRHRTGLGIFSTANLAFIVWIVLSGARDFLLEQRFLDILYVILLAIGQHLFYLALNLGVVWYILRMPAPEAVASGLMASQKSSPVAVTVISYITSDAAQQGLMAIPCLVGQIFQVFIGSALIPFFSKLVQRYETAKAAAATAVEPAAQDNGSSRGSEAGGQDDAVGRGGLALQLAGKGLGQGSDEGSPKPSVEEEWQEAGGRGAPAKEGGHDRSASAVEGKATARDLEAQ